MPGFLARLEEAGHALPEFTGAGLRVRWGETFLIRFDGAYSPTDGTTGFYVDVGHVF